MNSKNNSNTTSFLHEFQLEGKAQGGKIAMENWEDAMNDLTHIKNDVAADQLRKIDYENWPKIKMATYCHDCDKIVIPEMKEFRRGRSKKTFDRLVCGECGSKKISSGREEALRQFYHLQEDDQEETVKKIEYEQKPKKRFQQNQSRKKSKSEK